MESVIVYNNLGNDIHYKCSFCDEVGVVSEYDCFEEVLGEKGWIRKGGKIYCDNCKEKYNI